PGTTTSQTLDTQVDMFVVKADGGLYCQEQYGTLCDVTAAGKTSVRNANIKLSAVTGDRWAGSDAPVSGSQYSKGKQRNEDGSITDDQGRTESIVTTKGGETTDSVRWTYDNDGRYTIDHVDSDGVRTITRGKAGDPTEDRTIIQPDGTVTHEHVDANGNVTEGE